MFSAVAWQLQELPQTELELVVMSVEGSQKPAGLGEGVADVVVLVDEELCPPPEEPVFGFT